MFSFAPILLEVFFVLLKPQELYEWLLAFKPLYTLPALIAVGFMFDGLFDSDRFGRRVGSIGGAPFLKAAVFFFVWTLITAAIRNPSEIVPQAVLFGTPMIMSLAIAHCIRSWKLYQAFAAAMLALALFLSFIGTHQASAPFRCHWIDPVDRTILHYEGSPCAGPEAEAECYTGDEGADHGRAYVCEHAGLWGTASVSGRIRFRGNLEDPNELSLTVAIAFPFVFAYFQRKKNALRLLVMLGSLGLIGSCVFYSQSRGGQVVLLVVLGTFFTLRYGWKIGAIAGGIASIPMAALMAMSGRSESEAEGSSLERVECLAVGLELVKTSPIFGIGKGQFGEYHFLTAHNSYVLAAAETGIVGFAVWSFVMFLAVKIPWSALKMLKDRKGADAARARTYAGAMLASTIGLVVGSFFLSFTYHPILWIYVGFSGALYGVIKRDIPEWKVRLTQKDAILIVIGNLTLLTAIFIYSKVKLH